LAFDVYFAKCGGTKAFEESGGLSDLHSTSVIINDALCTMRFEEITARFIVFEAKLVSEETQCDVSISALVSATTGIERWMLLTLERC
jgi:hypothetical protein